MDISNKNISDNDFNSYWLSIYKELNRLFESSTCDCTEVYNNIFIICTSVSNLEIKLYWKILDYAYNKCIKLREEIINSNTNNNSNNINTNNNLIINYAIAFTKYKQFILSLNKMCCFLNDCIEDMEPIERASFLLWEKSIIQELPSNFFDEVYWFKIDDNTINNTNNILLEKNIVLENNLYNTNILYSNIIRLSIINSLKYIIPLPSNPLLYYIDKYECNAINNTILKYNYICNISDIREYASRVKDIVEEERENMKYYFLPSSREKVASRVEELLYKGREESIVESISKIYTYTYNSDKNNINIDNSDIYNINTNIINNDNTNNIYNTFYNNEIYNR